MDALAALDPSQAGGPEGAALFEPPPQQQQQQQQVVREDPSALAPMSAELRRRIAETARKVGASELPPELQAYIDSGLIEPAFMSTNALCRMTSTGRRRGLFATSNFVRCTHNFPMGAISLRCSIVAIRVASRATVARVSAGSRRRTTSGIVRCDGIRMRRCGCLGISRS